jgi:hypothetical protein
MLLEPGGTARRGEQICTSATATPSVLLYPPGYGFRKQRVAMSCLTPPKAHMIQCCIVRDASRIATAPKRPCYLIEFNAWAG